MKEVNRTRVEKKIMKYLKKIHKVYLNYLDNIPEGEGISEGQKEQAYLSLTSFRDSVIFNNSPKLPDKYYMSTWEGINDKNK